MKIDNSWTVHPETQHIDTEHFWGEIRVKLHADGEYYIDVTGGLKHRDVHFHQGIRTDGTIKFIEPRGVIKTIQRNVDSRLHGPQEDKTVVLKPGDGLASLLFIIQMDGPTKTIKLLTSESELEER